MNPFDAFDSWCNRQPRFVQVAVNMASCCAVFIVLGLCALVALRLMIGKR